VICRGKWKFTTDHLDDPSQARALRHRVMSKGKKKVTSEGRITRNAEDYLRDLIRLPPGEPGTYPVEATMELTERRTLGPMTGEFVNRARQRNSS
jgi:hypothetical protein